MAYNELDTVRELPEYSLQDHKQHLVLYYGMDDGWCPVEYGKSISEKFSPDELEVIFCEHECKHAFVIKSGPLIANIVSEMISMH